MPFSTESMIELQEREIEQRKADQLPQGDYNFIVDRADVFDANGLPKLSINMKIVSSKDGMFVGRYQSDFLGWFASEQSQSEKPIEQRESTLRRMTSRSLDEYIKALADAPYSTQEIGDLLNKEHANLKGLDDVGEVTECFEAIGALLQGQELTATIKHAANGPWVNVYAKPYNATIGAEFSVTV